mgnify:CR=1|jgi:hypothetical protein|tara:strand:+ start:11036 stop:11638 length:603 start_codon:yes stop_codon:yes gene_type:complete
MANSLSPLALKKIMQQAAKEKIFLKEIKISIKNKVVDAHEEFLKKFNSHPVTTEIEGGPSASNMSRTLGGVGNLYTYIGFPSGSSPIRPLRILLEKYKIRYHHTKQGIRITVELPTKEEAFQVTPMPWATGRSWARGIERGISGLGRYLVSSRNIAKSRSGKAIEVKGRVRGGRFSNTSYLSTLLNDYYKKIQQLERKTF